MKLPTASRIILVLGVIAGAAGCGLDSGADAEESDQGIVSGRPAGGVGVVRLTISDGKKGSECTGTMIAGNRILTAGHCVDPWLTIRAGRGVTYLFQADLPAFAEYTKDGKNFVCMTNTANATCGTADLVNMHVSRLGNGDLAPDIAVVRFASPLGGIRSKELREISTGDLRVKQQVEEWGTGFTDTAGTTGGNQQLVMMRSLVRITEVKATTIKTSDTSSQICHGDSGGPIFSGPSDLVVGVLSRFGSSMTGQCDALNVQPGWARITPAVIDFLNTNAQAGDTTCSETIPGTGFYACF